MSAVICTAFGPLDDLVIGEAPQLDAAPGEVVIDVAAASVNFLDVLMIQGQYQLKPTLPFSPGCEASGVIRAVGDGIAELKPGQRVMAFVEYGAFAARVRANGNFVFPIPDSMSFEEAAGFLVTYGTTFHALIRRARLAEGEALLVLGAAGGVGLTAVEIGRESGAHVIAAASADGKLALCERYGARSLINYAREDLRERIKELCGGKGVDVVFDPVGGELAEPALRSLAFLGRYLVIGFASGTIPQIPLNRLLLRSLTVHGITWGAFGRVRPAEVAEDVAVLLQWHQAGRLKPHISDVFPLAEFRQALHALIDRKAQGKVIIRIAE